MTAPAPQQPLTYQEALAAAAALQAAGTVPDVTAVVATLSEQTATVRDRVLQWALNLILGEWRDVNVYDGRAVQAFTTTAAVHLETAQTVVARSAAAAQNQILSSMGVNAPSTPSNPVDVRGTPVVDDDGTITVEQGRSEVTYQDGGRQVIDLDEDASTLGIFNRPARTQRYLESIGKGSAESRGEAEQRMAVLVGDNLMLAQRLAEAEIIAHAASVDERITGLRRVIHPELSRTGVCGLCIAASDRLYRVRDLVEIHTNCKCTVAAVTDEFDPADVLNKADLAQLYKLSGGTSSPELKRLRFQVDEHGELGPSLVPAKPYTKRKEFRPGPRRVNAPRRRKARSRR